MMRSSKKYLPIIIGMLILFPVFILPSIQATLNINEHDHDECDHDHDDHLQLSYIPCDCGNPGCTGNVATCPWALGRPYPAPTLTQPPSPDTDGIITLTWTSAYGANSYKIYRSDAELGTYTLIATTSSLTYTDTRTNGEWWYYIRAHNNNGDSGAGNKVSVEVYTDPPWFEWNEDYNIGDCPLNEWEPYYPSYDDIEIVLASSYGVDMSGKVIRMYSAGYGMGTGMVRDETFPIDTGESLYLSFRAQMNKDLVTGDGIITLYGLGTEIFLQITFDSYDEFYPRIWLEFADGEIKQYADLEVNRVYNFDIMFTKDPNTNLMKYLIFIDQKLEFIYEVNTALYPALTTVELYMDYYPGPGEFFLDNFFLGYVDNYISPKEEVDTAFPVYFLYVPQWTTGMDHVLSMSMRFRYDRIYTPQTLRFSLSLGLTFCEVIGVDTEVPLEDVIPTTPEYNYEVFEVATDTEDVIVFYRITADIANITFYLPGIHPVAYVSEIKGMYQYDFIDEHLTSSSITAFEQEFKTLPQEYYDYSRSGNAEIYDYRTTTAACTGNQWKAYELERKILDLSWETEWGLSTSIPIIQYYGIDILAFDFGIVFRTECTDIYHNEIGVYVRWDADTEEEDKIQYDLYAPPEGSYSTSLDLPPLSLEQVEYHMPTKATGLTATPGQKRVDLSWTANPESDIDHYNIYRNNVKVGESTTTSYADTGLQDATTYTYKVAAVNDYNEEGPHSNSVQATTLPGNPGFTAIVLISTLAIGLIIVLYRFRVKLKKSDIT